MENDNLKQMAMKELATREMARRSQANPDMQGGAQSPANVQAQQDLKQAQQGVGLPAQIGMGVKAIAEPTGRLANSALFGVPGITSELLSGGKLVNPIKNGLRVTQGGTNVFEGGDMSPGQKLAADVGGMLVPGGAILKATGLEKQIGNVIKYSKPENTAKLADEVDNALINSRSKVIDNYGPEYKGIIGKSDVKVNLAEPVKNLIDESGSILQNPEFINSPQSKRIIGLIDTVKDNKTLENISAQEADNIQKAIKQLPSIKTKLQKAATSGKHTVDWTNDERILLNFSNDIKSKVIEAHPELVDLNKGYGDFMNNYKQVRGSFGIKKTPDAGTEGLMKNYHNIPQRFKDTVEKVLPKETANKIKEYNKSQRVGETLKAAGLMGLGAAGLEKYKELVH